MSVIRLLAVAVKTTTLTYKLLVTSVLITQVVNAVRKNSNEKRQSKTSKSEVNE